MTAVPFAATTETGPPLSIETLTRLRNQLIADCAYEASLARAGRATADDLAGRTDMVGIRRREAVADAVERSNQAITDIFLAVLRIDADTYGWCEVCGAGIPSEHLEAMPRRRCCVACAPVPAGARANEGWATGS